MDSALNVGVNESWCECRKADSPLDVAEIRAGFTEELHGGSDRNHGEVLARGHVNGGCPRQRERCLQSLRGAGNLEYLKTVTCH